MTKLLIQKSPKRDQTELQGGKGGFAPLGPRDSCWSLFDNCSTSLFFSSASFITSFIKNLLPSPIIVQLRPPLPLPLLLLTLIVPILAQQSLRCVFMAAPIVLFHAVIRVYLYIYIYVYIGIVTYIHI